MAESPSIFEVGTVRREEGADERPDPLRFVFSPIAFDTLSIVDRMRCHDRCCGRRRWPSLENALLWENGILTGQFGVDGLAGSLKTCDGNFRRNILIGTGNGSRLRDDEFSRVMSSSRERISCF